MEYESIIVKNFLKLEKGELLSINTEECDFSFARDIANVALKITEVPVKIVVTNNGKPSDVVDFEPENPFARSIGFALLRLKHITPVSKNNEKVLDIKIDKDDLAALQKLGHLAEPILLNRRIAVPWCVMPVYENQDPRKNMFFKSLENDFDSRSLVIKYRCDFLNKSDIDTLHLVGDCTDFTVDVPQGTCFVGGPCKSSNNREFLSSIDYECLSCIVDMNSINGKVTAKTIVLGKELTVELIYKNGRLVDYGDNNELKTLFEFDNKLTKPGYIKMSDKKFELYLGGSLLTCFLNEPESEDKLPSFFNSSLYSIRLELPNNINIIYQGCNKTEKELVRKGFFLE